MAPTAGEEFSFQLQHLTEDLFSPIFFYNYICFSERYSSEYQKVVWFVRGVNGDAHTCSNQLVQTQSASVNLLLDACRKNKQFKQFLTPVRCFFSAGAPVCCLDPTAELWAGTEPRSHTCLHRISSPLDATGTKGAV